MRRAVKAGTCPDSNTFWMVGCNGTSMWGRGVHGLHVAKAVEVLIKDMGQNRTGSFFGRTKGVYQQPAGPRYQNLVEVHAGA